VFSVAEVKWAIDDDVQVAAGLSLEGILVFLLKMSKLETH